MEYFSRIADQILKDKLEAKGAVLIRGPKWCGKTTTASQRARSILYMSDPAERRNNLELAELHPAVLLEGATPRLIDEWQIAPQLWDAVRFQVDIRQKPGQFILTGSAVPVERTASGHEAIFHTGTGRFSIIDMAPMSLFESKDSSGEVSLADLFTTPEQISGRNSLQLGDIAFLACRGGWPYPIQAGMSRQAALANADDYLDLVVEEDISRVDGTARNPQRARAILRSYARHQGAPTPVSVLRKDVAANIGSGISDDTVSNYLNALQQIFVIKDLPAWNPNLRSKSAIRTSPTRYFTAYRSKWVLKSL